MILRGYLEFRSIEVVTVEKPKIYTVGGFSAISADGRPYIFDWEESSSGARIEDGKLFMDSELKCFDEEYFKDSNAEVSLDEITPEFIATSKLTEAFYECYSDEYEEDFIPLELVSFNLCTENSEKAFSEEQLNAFNESVREEYLKNLNSQPLSATNCQILPVENLETLFRILNKECMKYQK